MITSGKIQVLEIPPEVKADGWSSVLTTLTNILGSLLVVSGIILIFTPLFPIGFKMTIGGSLLLASEAFKEEISWFVTELLGAEGAQFAGGGISVLIGATTYKIGTKLWGKGITGTTLGILLNIIGELLMLAGTAEISEVILDYNFIKEWTGISDILYSDIYRTLTFASTVSIITYYLLSSFYERVGTVRDSTSTNSKPMQEHHYLSNKNKTYTPKFENITSKYGLDLNDWWNKDSMLHLGRHANAYHEYMLNSITRIDMIAKGDVNLFLRLFSELKQEIFLNPDMLYKAYWQKFK